MLREILQASKSNKRVETESLCSVLCHSGADDTGKPGSTEDRMKESDTKFLNNYLSSCEQAQFCQLSDVATKIRQLQFHNHVSWKQQL